MSIPQPKIKGHSIVLIGNFNPKIFQPSWFGSQGLLQKQEAEEAEVEIIHSDVAIFRLEWLRMEVTRERFLVETLQEAYDLTLRDLVLGTFSLLRFTPIKKMGINRDTHFQVDSEEKWHSVGNKLAPKDLWQEILERPGMISLTMEGNQKRDGLEGFIRVKIEPSARIPMGVFFSVNDHFEFKETDASVGSDTVISILREYWEKSYKRSERIIYSLLEKLL